jgi:Holliday junction resolvasome RuvABC endonuclease subunit
MIIGGIDYSMTSPAICIYGGNSYSEWDIKKCNIYYYVKKEKLIKNSDLYEGTLYPSYTSNEERFDNLTNWIIDKCKKHKVESMSLEGYAYGAKGKLAEIGENTGLLKHKLWKNNISLSVYTPGSIKKFASGKGNADKQMMVDAFKTETNIDMFKELEMKEGKDWNPISDMIDSYWICKLHASLIL